MKRLKKAIALALAAMMLAGIAGCTKEGPAEKAGKKIDQAVDKAKKLFD